MPVLLLDQLQPASYEFETRTRANFDLIEAPGHFKHASERQIFRYIAIAEIEFCNAHKLIGPGNRTSTSLVVAKVPEPQQRPWPLDGPAADSRLFGED